MNFRVEDLFVTVMPDTWRAEDGCKVCTHATEREGPGNVCGPCTHCTDRTATGSPCASDDPATQNCLGPCLNTCGQVSCEQATACDATYCSEAQLEAWRDEQFALLMRELEGTLVGA